MRGTVQHSRTHSQDDLKTLLILLGVSETAELLHVVGQQGQFALVRFLVSLAPVLGGLMQSSVFIVNLKSARLTMCVYFRISPRYVDLITEKSLRYNFSKFQKVIKDIVFRQDGP